MASSAKTMDENDRRNLLKVGADSYHDAIFALNRFQHAVQDICRSVIYKRLAEYTEALGIRDHPLDRSEVKDHVDPAAPSGWKGDYWGLGVKIQRKEPKGGWEVYCLLSWEPEGLYAWIGEWFSPKIASRLAKRLGENVEFEDGDFGISRTLRSEEIENFETDLDGFVREWIAIRKKVGGIEKTFED